MTKISIVTPCYYNGMNLPETYEAVKRDVFDVRKDIDFEWVLVDDGSGDDTLFQAVKIQKQDPRVKVVKLSRNFGEFRAIVAGMSQAEGEAVAVISADLQDPPDLIPEMLASWEKGNLVNLAVRKDREESALKNWFADTYYKLVRKWVEPNYPKRGFDFFLIDKKVAEELVEMQEKNSSIYLQLIWLGYEPTTIEYTRRDREKGQSMWTYAKRINLFIDTFIVFSNKPIRFITCSGVIISFIGLLSAIYFIIDKLKNNVVSGWTSLMVVILMLSGFQMVMLGIIGEYMWRNLDESRNRPLYVIEKVLKKEDVRYEYHGEQSETNV
ncbi:MAG: glycosyltransferase family 2 protein [Erysipelotrichaceae bacterium]|nr:glycosyltransferase family 2 protein [Erysipelotrichaceae bacterium]